MAIKLQELLAQQEQDLDGIMSIYLTQHLTCLLLQHAGTLEVREGDIEKGRIMLDAVGEMRALLAKREDEIVSVFKKEELEASRRRIGYDKKLYSQLSDAAIKSNAVYYDMARPQGAEYEVNEAVSTKTTDNLMREYFPSLMAA